jgi:hypothetical protein
MPGKRGQGTGDMPRRRPGGERGETARGRSEKDGELARVIGEDNESERESESESERVVVQVVVVVW